MTTLASAQLKRLASAWERLYPSAVTSGIVGDPAHAAAGGYHISREDQVNGSNYSVVRSDDKGGPSNLAAAVDMSMSVPDMKLCTSRLRKVYLDKSDPRRNFLNAFNGWDGSGDAQRWDFYADAVSWATEDHKWHVHLEVRRRYVTSDSAVDAILSALAGDSVDEYLELSGSSVRLVSSVTIPEEDQEMIIVLHPNGSGYHLTSKGMVWVPANVRRNMQGAVTYVKTDDATWKRYRSAFGVISEGK